MDHIPANMTLPLVMNVSIAQNMRLYQRPAQVSQTPTVVELATMVITSMLRMLHMHVTSAPIVVLMEKMRYSPSVSAMALVQDTAVPERIRTVVLPSNHQPAAE